MAEPQLSVRSAKARDLAHRIARREKRTIADIVERALEDYARRSSGNEPAEKFYTSLAQDCGVDDVDLQKIIDENRRPHRGIDL